jgi:secondary thiamine-phosphate synthase enzyme
VRNPHRLLGPVKSADVTCIASGELVVETAGAGFTDITANARQFIEQAGAGDGVLFVFLRHTSASLTIQENADPDVQRDLMTALERLAPQDAGWVHDTEGPDDMPAHIKAMLSGVSLHIPVLGGKLGLGTWQGLYLVEHRSAPHSRRLTLQFMGTRR